MYDRSGLGDVLAPLRRIAFPPSGAVADSRDGAEIDPTPPAELRFLPPASLSVPKGRYSLSTRPTASADAPDADAASEVEIV